MQPRSYPFAAFATCSLPKEAVSSDIPGRKTYPMIARFPGLSVRDETPTHDAELKRPLDYKKDSRYGLSKTIRGKRKFTPILYPPSTPRHSVCANDDHASTQTGFERLNLCRGAVHDGSTCSVGFIDTQPDATTGHATVYRFKFNFHQVILKSESPPAPCAMARFPEWNPHQRNVSGITLMWVRSPCRRSTFFFTRHGPIPIMRKVQMTPYNPFEETVVGP